MNCEKCPIKEECEKLRLKGKNFCPILYVVKRYIRREIEEGIALHKMMELAEELEKIVEKRF